MDSAARIQAVRGFNRFYTRQIGVLQQPWLGSPFSLAEGRVLYEIAHHEQPTASDVSGELGLDAGYASRMLRSLEQRGFVRRTRSTTDGRRAHLSLTRSGQAAFARLNQQSQDDVAAMLQRLPVGDQRRLVTAMKAIERLLGAKPEHGTSYVLRPPQAGDLGWIVYRQGALYAEEWGYNEEFEALAAAIVAEYVAAVASIDGALLDRGKGRRDCRLGLPRPQIEHRGKAPIAVRRTISAWPWHRLPPDRRVRTVRKAGGLSEDHPVDTERARRRQAPVQEGRVHADREKASRQFWQEEPRGRDVGPSALREEARSSGRADATQYHGRITVPSRRLVVPHE